MSTRIDNLSTAVRDYLFNEPEKVEDPNVPFWNGANKITLSRLVVAPFILLAFFTWELHWLGMLITAFVIWTDKWDGIYAKNNNCRTIKGAELDATTDMVVMFAVGGPIALWLLEGQFQAVMYWIIGVQAFSALVVVIGTQVMKRTIHTHPLGRVGLTVRALAVYMAVGGQCYESVGSNNVYLWTMYVTTGVGVALALVVAALYGRKAFSPNPV